MKQKKPAYGDMLKYIRGGHRYPATHFDCRGQALC